MKIGPDGSVLTIAKARPGNQGQYRCVASNSAGRSTANAVLNVKRELAFHIPDFPQPYVQFQGWKKPCNSLNDYFILDPFD